MVGVELEAFLLVFPLLQSVPKVSYIGTCGIVPFQSAHASGVYKRQRPNTVS